MIGGLSNVDVADWKKHTKLKHCTADSDVVRWFWKAVEESDGERRRKILRFVLGSSRLPLQGFKALQGMYAWMCVLRYVVCSLVWLGWILTIMG